jgi:hypothetical protein
MRTLNKIIVILIAAGLAFSACNKENDLALADQGGVKLTFKAITSGTLKSAAIGTTEITEAWLGVEKIKFKPLTEEKGRTDKIVFIGPYIADLVAGTTTPEIDWTQIESGLYKEVEFESESVLENEQSVLIRGTITYNDLPYPFEFSTGDNGFSFEVENEKGIMIEEGKIADVMVLFDLTMLFNEIDLTDAVAGENGYIFNDEVNKYYTELLKENLKELCKLKFEEEEEDDD